MYIKKIILAVASLLNKPEVINYIENGKEEGEVLKDVDKLTRLTNLVITELATMGIYVMKTQNAYVSKGKVYYSALSNKPIHIFYFEDGEGNRYDFKVGVEYAEVDSRATTITYAYAPSNEGLDAKIIFTEIGLTEAIMAMGVCAEYLLTLNDFDGAIYWHQKYVESIEKINSKPKSVIVKNVQIKGRSFT